MRVFTRHDSTMPVEVLSEEFNIEERKSILNIGTGGLAFKSEKNFVPGTFVKLRIPFVKPVFASDARIAWRKKIRDEYIVGVEFLKSDDIFKIRMVEQVCEIENFRKKMESEENIELSSGSAALEWQSRFANTFQTYTAKNGKNSSQKKENL